MKRGSSSTSQRRYRLFHLPLTSINIRQAKAGDKPTKLTDANGLYLFVKPSGSRLWRDVKRFTEQRIIGFLKDAEAGMPVKELCMRHGFSDASF